MPKIMQSTLSRIEAYAVAVQRHRAAAVALHEAGLLEQQTLHAYQEAWRQCKGLPEGAYLLPGNRVVVVGSGDYPRVVELAVIDA